MLALPGSSPDELATSIAARARALRLAANLTQAGLAARAGVSLASLRRFERTGEIALLSLIRLAIALGVDHELESIFRPRELRSLDELIARPRTRKRGSFT
jgi:transcriptional regulator with XRE-family HTH domain